MNSRIAEFTVWGEAMKKELVLEPGDRARKVGGSYQATGTVRSTFLTRYGQRRYVLDFDTPAGLLHIFSHEQLEPLDV